MNERAKWNVKIFLRASIIADVKFELVCMDPRGDINDVNYCMVSLSWR